MGFGDTMVFVYYWIKGFFCKEKEVAPPEAPRYTYRVTYEDRGFNGKVDGVLEEDILIYPEHNTAALSKDLDNAVRRLKRATSKAAKKKSSKKVSKKKVTKKKTVKKKTQSDRRYKTLKKPASKKTSSKKSRSK